MNITQRQVGFFQIILSGVCFGFLGYFGKIAYLRGLSPGELLSMRYLLSAIMTGLIILVTNPKSFLLINSCEIICSLLLGIFGYALFSSFYFMALTKLSASLTVLLLYTYPVMVTILSHFFLKEKIGKRGVIALIVVSIGLIGLVWGEFYSSKPLYLLFGLSAAFFYALYILLSRKYLSRSPTLPTSFFVQLGAGVVLTLINFYGKPNHFSELFIHNYQFLLSMSFLCSLMAMTLFLAGLQKIPSSEASILSTTEPISGVILAVTLLGESIQFIQIIGGVMILIGMILIATKKELN